jgi:hypothetical protein
MMHKDQFTATGPSNTGAGFPRAAFSTKSLGEAQQFIHGLNVEGSDCGIYAISGGTNHGRKPGIVNTGVWGDGLHAGVEGRSDNIGVRGEGGASGVEGESDKGPGGRFISNRAQVHLKPAKELPGVAGISEQLPSKGRKGDLFALDGVAEGATLWFCERSATELTGAWWGQVAFTQVRQGNRA